MTHTEIFLILSLIVGLYAAWNIGANDVSNAMGTSVGSKALTLRQAVLIAAVFEFTGAVLFGSNVSETLQKSIINPEIFENAPYKLAIGMLASLLATGIWLQAATYFGLPVSTTHSIVGAIVGFGCIIGGFDAVIWETVFSIAGSWILSPFLGGMISFALFTFLRQKIFYASYPYRAAKRLMPFLVFAVALVLSLIAMYKIIAPHSGFLIKMAVVLGISGTSGLIAFIALRYYKGPRHVQKTVSVKSSPLVKEVDQAKQHLLCLEKQTQGEMRYRVQDILEEVESLRYSLQENPHLELRNTEFIYVEKIFAILQILSACLMAFSHGSNDVANAIGPLAAIVSLVTTGAISVSGDIPLWILALGGFGIVVGLATWGWRVIETIGRRITELTPSRGFSAEFGAAATILLASRFGFPISTTHTLVGAVLGVGLAGGIGALNLKTIRDIVISWFITIPAGALLSIICYLIIEPLFL